MAFSSKLYFVAYFKHGNFSFLIDGPFVHEYEAIEKRDQHPWKYELERLKIVSTEMMFELEE